MIGFTIRSSIFESENMSKFSADLSHSSANGNNSNNKKGQRLPQRSYDPVKGKFRPKSRSIQLSSIRAVSGMDKRINIQPYHDRIVCKDGSAHVQYKVKF